LGSLFRQTPSLITLYLANNQLVNLPESIAELTNLLELNLVGNPLSSATRQYLDANPNLHAYYSDISAFEVSRNGPLDLTQIFPNEEERAAGAAVATERAAGVSWVGSLYRCFSRSARVAPAPMAEEAAGAPGGAAVTALAESRRGAAAEQSRGL